MPRGKKKVVSVAERIEAVKAEIESLGAQLKEKKAELKKKYGITGYEAVITKGTAPIILTAIHAKAVIANPSLA